MTDPSDGSLIAASHDPDEHAERSAEMASLDATAPDDDLSEYLEADPDEIVGGDPPPDIDFADRMLRKLRRLTREILEVTQSADRERARVDEWERQRNESKLRQRAQTEAWLDSWMRQHELATGKVTENLLNGHLSLREGSPSFVCTDPKAFYEWCMSTPSERARWAKATMEYKPDAGKLRFLLRPGEALGPADAKGLISYAAHDPNTGELVPTVAIRKPAQKTFTVELSGS